MPLVARTFDLRLDEDAPWEGIGTGWFYSALGGGKDLRPSVSKRTNVDFDNTFAEWMRGDRAVPTIFNGNFDAVTTPDDRLAIYPNTQLARSRYEMPGWAFHNGKSGEVNTYESLYLENVYPSGDDSNRNYALSMGTPKIATGVGKPGDLPPLTEITHNRMYIPDSVQTLTFDIQVTENSSDDLIEVFYNNQGGEWLKLDELGLQEATNGFNTELFTLPENFSGQISQLQFRLIDKNEDGLDAKLLLDNIFFV